MVYYEIFKLSKYKKSDIRKNIWLIEYKQLKNTENIINNYLLNLCLINFLSNYC